MKDQDKADWGWRQGVEGTHLSVPQKAHPAGEFVIVA